jgi:DNA-binding HxlR family transcriptional regulator
MLSTELQVLSKSRWAIPALAILGQHGGGAKFVTIVQQLECSKDSVTRTLSHLITHKLVLRNPGHGHPLRPEYLLTTYGATLAADCANIVSYQRRLGLQPHEFGRWSLPVVAGIADAPTRFSELQAQLYPVTPRALSQTLQDLVGHSLVVREVADDFPPKTFYDLTRAGRRLARLLT